MKKLVLCLALLIPAKSKADPNVVWHCVGSFALTAGMYYTMSAFTGREKQTKKPSLLGALLFSAAYTTSFEIMEARGGKLNGKDMATNLICHGAAAGTIIAIDF